MEGGQRHTLAGCDCHQYHDEFDLTSYGASLFSNRDFEMIPFPIAVFMIASHVLNKCRKSESHSEEVPSCTRFERTRTKNIPSRFEFIVSFYICMARCTLMESPAANFTGGWGRASSQQFATGLHLPALVISSAAHV